MSKWNIGNKRWKMNPGAKTQTHSQVNGPPHRETMTLQLAFTLLFLLL